MESTIALPGSYAAPAVMLDSETAQVDEVVWWAVAVGFAYALALAYATYCRITGGDPEISFGWRGFKIACKSP
jgi:hypothetical protein